jgi:hypothetical protein
MEGSRRKRLLLRPLTLDDLHDVALLHAQESFWHYPFRRGWSREETAAFSNGPSTGIPIR